MYAGVGTTKVRVFISGMTHVAVLMTAVELTEVMLRAGGRTGGDADEKRRKYYSVRVMYIYILYFRNERAETGDTIITITLYSTTVYVYYYNFYYNRRLLRFYQ